MFEFVKTHSAVHALDDKNQPRRFYLALASDVPYFEFQEMTAELQAFEF